MIISDEKTYNYLKRRAGEYGWIRVSRAEIAAGTGLSHWTIHMALARLMKARRLWWEKPVRESPDRFKVSFYTIDPDLSRIEYKRRRQSLNPADGG